MIVSEIFYSLQGEGRYTGHPMIFIRTFGCNFTCSGFSNPQGDDDVMEADGMFLTGCDSRYSWDKSVGDRKSYTNEELYKEILSVSSPAKRQPILCFTGGEPMLQQKRIADFINYYREETAEFILRGGAGITHILFETNASIKVSWELHNALTGWLQDSVHNRVIWSNSPKLSNSGELEERAIVPEVLLSQCLTLNLKNEVSRQIKMYLKYVSDGSNKSFGEIAKATDKYQSFLSLYTRCKMIEDVYVMAEGATKAQQEANMTTVVEQCLVRGYIFCARVHTWVWGNKKGT